MKTFFMYTRSIQLFLVVLLIVLLGCKKESTDTTPPAVVNQLKIDDGPLSASLGKRISYGESSGFTWGRNSDEIITFTNNSKLLRIDLPAAKAEEIASLQMIGKDIDNSALIMAGKINTILGYYSYNFDTKKTEEILSFQQDDGTILNKSGNNIFFYTTKVSPPVQCDGFCWGSYTGADPNAKFSYLDFAAKKAVPLIGKSFTCFSKDGTKALLSSQDSFFIFDHTAKKITDSFRFEYAYFPGFNFTQSTIYFDTEPLVIAALVSSGEMSVRKLRTGQEIQKIPPLFPSDFTNFKWSADGTKIYYISIKCSLCDNIYLGIYDLSTKQEKIIIENVTYATGGSNPLESVELSPDNKRILVRYQNEYYFRDIN